MQKENKITEMMFLIEQIKYIRLNFKFSIFFFSSFNKKTKKKKMDSQKNISTSVSLEQLQFYVTSSKKQILCYDIHPIDPYVVIGK